MNRAERLARRNREQAQQVSVTRMRKIVAEKKRKERKQIDKKYGKNVQKLKGYVLKAKYRTTQR